MNTLTKEEIEKKEAYEKLHNCEVVVAVLPLDRKRTETATCYFREPTLTELDAFMRQDVTNPLLSKQSLLFTLLLGEDAEKKAICANRYAVLASISVIDEITSFFNAVIKKNSENTE